MSQNLRSLYSSYQLPEGLHSLVQKFSAAFDHDIRRTFLSEDSDNHSSDSSLRSTKEGVLTRGTYRLLVSWTETHDNRVFEDLSSKVLYRHAVYNHVLYKVHKRSPPDSHIIFTSDDAPEGRPGYIECMFTHIRKTTRGEHIQDTFAVVYPYQIINSKGSHLNIPLHISKFSSVCGFLFQKTNLVPVVVHLNQIRGHFGYALTDYGDGSHSEIFQGIPLFKVCRSDSRYIFRMN